MSADVEPPRNVLVARTFSNQADDLLLALGDSHGLHRFPKASYWALLLGGPPIGCWAQQRDYPPLRCPRPRDSALIDRPRRCCRSMLSENRSVGWKRS